MELRKITKKIKCDFHGCKNLSDYDLVFKKQIIGGTFHFCKECLNQMYSVIGKEVVPQSVKNIYRKKDKGVADETN